MLAHSDNSVIRAAQTWYLSATLRLVDLPGAELGSIRKAGGLAVGRAEKNQSRGCKSARQGLFESHPHSRPLVCFVESSERPLGPRW